MKKLLLTLCLTSLLSASHCFASEQASDTDELKSPDQISDRYEDQQVPGESLPQEGRVFEKNAACDGGACPR